MPRLATLLVALLLAVPAAAFAQGAGDDQYQDPFGDTSTQQGSSGSSGGGGTAQTAQDGGLTDEPPSTGSGSGSSGSSGSSSGSSGSSAGQTGTTTTPQTAATTTAEQAAGQLPNTGSDPRVLALCGLAFLLIGLGLRLRTIDPDAY